MGGCNGAACARQLWRCYSAVIAAHQPTHPACTPTCSMMLSAYLAPREGGAPPPATACRSASAKMRSSCWLTVANRASADWPITASMWGEAAPWGGGREEPVHKLGMTAAGASRAGSCQPQAAITAAAYQTQWRARCGRPDLQRQHDVATQHLHVLHCILHLQVNKGQKVARMGMPCSKLDSKDTPWKRAASSFALHEGAGHPVHQCRSFLLFFFCSTQPTHVGRGDALHAVHPARIKLRIVHHHCRTGALWRQDGLCDRFVKRTQSGSVYRWKQDQGSSALLLTSH